MFREIVSERLRIRPFQQEDVKSVMHYMSDPEVVRWLPEGVLDKAGTRAFLKENQGEDACNFAITERGSDELVGHLVLHPWFVERCWEIGWIIDPAWQGRGYASEAAAAARDYVFSQLNVHRLIATAQPQNPPSWRVMEKIGMRKEGTFLQCIPQPDGSWWDEVFYAMLHDEWQALKIDEQ